MRGSLKRGFVVPALAIVLAATATLSRVFAAEPTSHEFDASGVKLHFLTEGKGEPVVLIHGLYSSAEINWRLTGVMADLAQDHEVIALDLPGHGRSDKPENDDAYGLRLVDDVLELLDHLQIKKAHIVGFSLGGMVAMKFLAQHPERAISGTIGGMGWVRAGSPLQKFCDRLPDGEQSRTPSAFLRNVGKLGLTANEVKSIGLPVTILVGERDPCRRHYVAPLRRIRPDWPVVEIKDAGHIDIVLRKEFRNEIGNWIRKQSKP
jgi:pimeloyl-ACP methyl ester carboxylesterase